MSYLVTTFPYVASERLFSEVADQSWAMFLDSGIVANKQPVTKNADFDVLAIKPRITLVTKQKITTISEGTNIIKTSGDPLLAVKQSIGKEPARKFQESEDDSPYLPGAIGYLSYDLARRFEALPSLSIDDEHMPEMAMGIYDAVVVVDHRKKNTQLIVRQDLSLNDELVSEWTNLIEECLAFPITHNFDHAQKIKPAKSSINENMTRADYYRCFDSVRDYTIAGDCYQVNLAKQFSVSVTNDPWSIYLALRTASPAPYGAYFNLPFAQVLSNSPESFIACRNHQVVTSPIKGTSARDHDNAKNDDAIGQALLNSAKDRAENLMIVDLMRNDLSRCCELGSISVPSLFSLHSFANVHHLISTIVGVLRPELHALDLLRSCFPGGSITGTPKIRAMQIVEELEPHRRGLYCGSIAYVGMDGSLETNIAIRTITIKDGTARFSAGGGLVIDSDVDEEYQEIIDKARMMTEALTE